MGLRDAWQALWKTKDTTIDIGNYRLSELWYGPGAGPVINHDTALQVSTVLACVRLISEDVAKLPITLFERTEGADSVVTNHPVHDLLSVRPNSWQIPFDFVSGITQQAVLTGWGFAVKQRDSSGRLASLVPVVSSRMDVRQRSGGGIDYVATDTEGDVVGTFAPDDVFVLRGPVWDRYNALDVVQKAREAIGLAAVTESTQSKLHANGGRPSGILTTDTPLKPEALARLKESWQAMHGGLDNSFKTAVLDNGLKFQPLTQSGVDSQHLETRRFQIEEVCRALGVFPQMVMHSDKASTYASAEAFFGAHLRHTLAPWLTRWQQTITRDLIVQRGRYYAKFDTNDLVKASLKDRAEAYRSLTESGVYTRNEIRVMEGLEALPGLDEPLTPMNMEGSNANEDA